MNTESLITLLRNEIEKTGYKCYSPDLPQNDENIVALSLGEGTNQRALNKDILYSDISFYLLIRGTSNDTNTRTIADTIFQQLDHKTSLENDNLRVILISCNLPNYAFRDENQRIHYNINCTAKVQWKE
ncbi:MAG TPA: hypothetical protein IAB27_03610 [Candidatus Coprosoma intestinipullorum]|uniref:Uncharacterized protein n=1 Tax=Candidatus Coprosoma intestinipullorum TaxID=2840752 RepID=A0A9D0ZR45_9FIRM|nr:hypothetical protein [Candidatus Coprosoma intestinipullorum]